MNDFSDIESQLRKLRPVAPSEDLVAQIERALKGGTSVADAPAGLPWWRRFTGTSYKLSLGFGLAAAAAAVLILAWVNFDSGKQTGKIAANPAPGLITPATTAEFVPVDFTRVVYHTSNDGLYYPSGSNRPVRRLRARARETFEWRNPRTGASLRISYPSDEVSLVPVSGQ